jgi:ankyrin repeat protein
MAGLAVQDGSNALMMTVCNGHKEIVAMLLQAGVNVNVQNEVIRYLVEVDVSFVVAACSVDLLFDYMPFSG